MIITTTSATGIHVQNYFYLTVRWIGLIKEQNSDWHLWKKAYINNYWCSTLKNLQQQKQTSS